MAGCVKAGSQAQTVHENSLALLEVSRFGSPPSSSAKSGCMNKADFYNHKSHKGETFGKGPEDNSRRARACRIQAACKILLQLRGAQLHLVGRLYELHHRLQIG